MRVLLVWMLIAVAFAGCAEAPAEPEEVDETFDDCESCDVEVTSDTGAIRGVVVDSSISPIAEATIIISGAGDEFELVSDDEGRFAKGGLAPGAYFLKATKYGFDEVQSSVEVVAGVETPDIVRIQMVASFTEEPFSVSFNFKGRVVCSYQAVIITAPCVTDYTSLVCPGGCAPQLREVQGDARDWEQEIGQGWKSHIIEMTWKSSAQGTSEQLGFAVSHTERTSTHWYGTFGGESPLLARFDCCGGHPSNQNAPEGIPEEGLPNLLTFVNVRGGGVQLAVEQDFEVFTHTFHNLAAPEDWSFIAGDEVPF